MANNNLPPPATGPTFDWRFFKDWLYKLWKSMQNFDLTGTTAGNTQIDGNLTVTGTTTMTGGIAVPTGANLTGMPLSLLSAAAGQSDGEVGLQFLPSSIHLFYSNAGGQSIPTNAYTTVTSWTKVYDTTSAFSAAAGTFTAPQSGYYLFASGMAFSSATWASTASLQISFTINGGGRAMTGVQIQSTTSNNMLMPPVTTTAYLNTGDVVAIKVFQNNGASVNTLANASFNWLSIDLLTTGAS